VKLLEEVNHLKALLEDPHPGLITWNEAYQKRLKEISSYYTGESESFNEDNDCSTCQVNDPGSISCDNCLDMETGFHTNYQGG